MCEIVLDSSTSSHWRLINQFIVFVDGERGRDIQRDRKCCSKFGGVIVRIVEQNIKFELVPDFDASRFSILNAFGQRFRKLNMP
jgi:hypothetical protein